MLQIYIKKTLYGVPSLAFKDISSAFATKTAVLLAAHSHKSKHVMPDTYICLTSHVKKSTTFSRGKAKKFLPTRCLSVIYSIDI